MSTWTAGAWADVAIGDDVLGGDGYAWRVTAGLINHFDIDGNGASLRITMEREPIGARTGDISAFKPVKYSAGEPRGIVVSCYACQRDEAPCDLHVSQKPDNGDGRSSERMTALASVVTDSSDWSSIGHPPEDVNDDSLCVEVNRKATVRRSSSPFPSGTGGVTGTDPSCLGCALDAHRCSGCAAPATHGETVCRTCAGTGGSDSGSSTPEVPRETSEIHCQPLAGGIACGPAGELTPGDRAAVEKFGAYLKASKAADDAGEPRPPYVEWTPEERAAGAALKAAGIEAKVIERVMTLSELTSHLQDTHGVELPARGPLIGVEYRARLADLHFDRHAADQGAGERWKPRGRTPHTHPVMDRPMDLKR